VSERDIFAFWSSVPDAAVVHPADARVFARCSHRFERDCLPLCFFGPLRTAPVVLLFLSPGFADPFDRLHAGSPEGRRYYRDQRTGAAPLPSPADHAPAFDWCRRVLAQFGLDAAAVRDRVAVLNIGAYHSKSFHDYAMLTALPSSRVALDWAQATLFPAAERGERVVVCLRAARLWGLSHGPDGGGQRFGASLFVPRCTQGGIIRRGPMREAVTAAVRRALDSGPTGS
jgi:hypothetical protein